MILVNIKIILQSKSYLKDKIYDTKLPKSIIWYYIYIILWAYIDNIISQQLIAEYNKETKQN